MIGYFVENLLHSKALIVIGYGFGDLEINRLIRENYLSAGNTMIIIDPNTPTTEFYQEIIQLDSVKHFHYGIEYIDPKEIAESY